MSAHFESLVFHIRNFHAAASQNKSGNLTLENESNKYIYIYMGNASTYF